MIQANVQIPSPGINGRPPRRDEAALIRRVCKRWGIPLEPSKPARLAGQCGGCHGGETILRHDALGREFQVCLKCAGWFFTTPLSESARQDFPTPVRLRDRAEGGAA